MRNENLYTMKQPELGKKISEIRKQKGLTQEELVEKCNINVRTIQRIEAGEVTPRSFTVKTILEALGLDYESVAEIEEYKEGKFDTILGITINNYLKLLNLSWVFGVVYFIVGFFEMASEYYLFSKETLLFENSIYVLIKLISIISFFFFIRGFIITGNLYKNYMLEIVAFITLILNTLFGLYDITSLFVFKESVVFAIAIQIISFGVLTILLGIGMLKLHKEFGTLPIVTGVFEMIAGLFLVFFLVEMGVAVIFPMQLLEIILLYKIYDSLKSA